MRERRNVRINGLVQGVGFREKVRRIALGHDVAGFVRNVGIDQVEIDVEGEPAVLDAFIAEVRARPPRASRVDGFITTPLPPQGVYGFSVAPTVRAG